MGREELIGDVLVEEGTLGHRGIEFPVSDDVGPLRRCFLHTHDGLGHMLSDEAEGATLG